MKSLLGSFTKQKSKIELEIQEEIEIVSKLISLLIDLGGRKNSEKDLVRVLELETEMEDKNNRFLQSINNKYSLPFYWEELYDLYMEIRKVFSYLMRYFNKRNILENTEIFNSFLTKQSEIMKNIVQFLKEYKTSRKYVQELLKNNGILVKSLTQLHFKIISNTVFESKDSLLKYNMMEILDNISNVDYNIQDLLNKILLTSGI